jgi:hypothetical protein
VYVKLRQQALKLDPLVGTTERQLENLLYLVSSERKAAAHDHRYREGTRYNEVVSHVGRVVTETRKRNRLQEEQTLIRVAQTEYKEDIEAYDRETKVQEKELRDRQKEQREALLASQHWELEALEERWKAPAKFRIYNRASNRLTILRRQRAFLLVQCRFKDAEEVSRLVEEETRVQQAESHTAMQRDYDEALKKVLARHADEMESFDERAAVQLLRLQQDRAIDRRVFENRGRKIVAREEIAKNGDTLWNHDQAKRARDVVENIRKLPVPSAKMSRKDIDDMDVAILDLPPLTMHRKLGKPPSEKKASDQ